MPPKNHMYTPAPDGDAPKLNQQSSALVRWACAKFNALLADDNYDAGHALIEEWFEWVDVKSYINESTLFFNGDELNELYKQSKG